MFNATVAGELAQAWSDRSCHGGRVQQTPGLDDHHNFARDQGHGPDSSARYRQESRRALCREPRTMLTTSTCFRDHPNREPRKESFPTKTRTHGVHVKSDLPSRCLGKSFLNRTRTRVLKAVGSKWHSSTCATFRRLREYGNNHALRGLGHSQLYRFRVQTLATSRSFR